eukprot:12956226-Alexandrium_andersonii.AAC.1
MHLLYLPWRTPHALHVSFAQLQNERGYLTTSLPRHNRADKRACYAGHAVCQHVAFAAHAFPLA